MITEKDLIEAIAECQGTRNPNANTCIKLASFYTILDHIKEDASGETARGFPYTQSYSYDGPKEERYMSQTEFGQLLDEKEPADVLMVVDELMETLRVMQPRLYSAFIRKIAAL